MCKVGVWMLVPKGSDEFDMVCIDEMRFLDLNNNNITMIFLFYFY